MDQNSIMQENKALTEPQNPSSMPPETTSTAQHEPGSAAIDPAAKAAAPSPKPPRTGRTGLIAALIALSCLIVAGCGVAFWYFGIYNNPENVAFDAVNKLLNAKNLMTRVEVSLDGNDTSHMELVLDFSSNHLPNAVTAYLMFTDGNDSNGVYQTEPFQLGPLRIMSDGILYIYTGDLAASYEEFLLSQGTNPNRLSATEAAIRNFLSRIDNEWWQISVPDLIDQMLPNTSFAQPGKDYYNCMINLVNDYQPREIAQLYKDNRFIEVTKLGHRPDLYDYDKGISTYEVSFQYNKLANFINALPETEFANQYYNCYNQYQRKVYSSYDYDLDGIHQISAQDFPIITEDELADNFPEDLQFYLHIANSGHELKYLSATQESSSYTAEVKVAFSYVDVEANSPYWQQSVSAPESYRPITDLFDEYTALLFEVSESEGWGLGDDYDYDYDYEPEYENYPQEIEA